MNLEIKTKKIAEGKEKSLYEITVELDADCMNCYNKGFQKFYRGTVKGMRGYSNFILGLEQRCGFKKADEDITDVSHKISATVKENDGLRKVLEDLEARYFIAPRNEWVSSTDYFVFYRPGATDSDYKHGTPVERLNQAAFDTRRTGKTWFDLGLLEEHDPDVKFMAQAIPKDEQYELGDKLNELSLAVHTYEANDGSIKPKLTIEEADKVAKLFEQMADLVEPFWKKVEKEYEAKKEEIFREMRKELKHEESK